MFTKKRVAALIIILAIIIVTPCIAAFGGKNESADRQMVVLKIWQIDAFEGGKGSRAQYLQNKADKLFKDRNIYVTVNSVSASSARENFKNGNFPDILSYGAGFYGLEQYLTDKNALNKVWCRGGYCLLSLNEQDDFSAVSAKNTVINEGKDNLAGAVALLTGLNGAAFERPTGAYVSLISGKYRYLLGTQRDIFRLKTRGVPFALKPVTAFNDLYQNICILGASEEKFSACKEFTDYLLTERGDINKIGMFGEATGIYDDELKAMEEAVFEKTLKSFISRDYLARIEECVKNADVNNLKKLLK